MEQRAQNPGRMSGSAHLKCLHGPEPNTAEKLQLPHYERGILAPYREKDLFLSSHPSADVTHKPPFSKLALISTEQFMSQKKDSFNQ